MSLTQPLRTRRIMGFEQAEHLLGAIYFLKKPFTHGVE